MSNYPSSTQPDEHGIYYLGKVGQRTHMTRGYDPPQQPPLLPPPSQLMGERRQLPPLPNLQPPVSQSTQSQHPSASFPEPPHSPHALPQSYGQSSAPESATAWQAPRQQSQPGPVSSFPHPALYAQKASYQSRNPGTVYEALSPVEYSTHGPGGPASLFNEAAYSQQPYQTAPVSSYQHQSPSGSYHSSASSAGVASGRGSSQYPQPLPATPGESPDMANEIVGRYVLTVRQQPIAARACGFGERDRRVIDPPPIVQLSLKDYNPSSPSDVAELRFPFNIVHCTLLSASPPQQQQQLQHPTSAPAMPSIPSSDVTAVADPNQNNRLSRRLMGTLVASPFMGTDPEAPPSLVEYGNLATFFIFPDLSCRQNGLYKLRFTLMKVAIGPNMVEGHPGSLCGSIDSDVFEVFSAKDFPGMRASTLLTRELKKQGAGVSVKKGKSSSSSAAAIAAAKDKRGESESGSGDEEEPEAKGKGRPRKRRG